VVGALHRQDLWVDKSERARSRSKKRILWKQPGIPDAKARSLHSGRRGVPGVLNGAEGSFGGAKVRGGTEKLYER